MSIRDLSSQEIEQLIGTRHGTTGIEFPPPGLSPYYSWLIRTLHHLAESSVGNLRVTRDEANPTSIHVMPGRATIGGEARAFVGETIDLAQFNNSSVLVSLQADGETCAVQITDETSNWPAPPHIKLARVALAEGKIVAVEDRRMDALFHA